MKILFILLCSILVIVAGCSALKPASLLNLVLSSKGYSFSSVAYGSLNRQQLDIYLPTLKQHKSPIVFIYGGAWTAGNKKDYKFVAHALTQLGHPVIIPDYRLYPEVTFPTFIDDIAQAIQHCENNAKQLLGSPLEDFILMGHSAGAYNAALLTTKPEYLGKQLTQKIRATIALSGPYDLPLDDPDVSPVFPAATNTNTNIISNTHSEMPPILLLHGLEDQRVLPFHTRHWQQALRKKGNSVEVHLYPKIKHVTILAGIAAPLRTISPSYKDIEHFLKALERF